MGARVWLKGADCKSVGYGLRWFKSISAHQNHRRYSLARTAPWKRGLVRSKLTSPTIKIWRVREWQQAVLNTVTGNTVEGSNPLPSANSRGIDMSDNIKRYELHVFLIDQEDVMPIKLYITSEPFDVTGHCQALVTEGFRYGDVYHPGHRIDQIIIHPAD